MKILDLKFKNLNSLYGEWHIDFTVPEYSSNGIFALIGPTGAGKSTLLDALCLALYGATPRLGKISKSGNEIMSRQTGDCYAEVTFETQSGRFRCHWSQHRSRRKSDGKLSESKHEISDAITGILLESKKRDVALVIEEKTGMDFDRFTRSILLAQGGFDTFLKADIEQKSKLLEQITGTGIYTEISKKVHEKQKQEQDQLTLLQFGVSGITLLTELEERDVRKKIEGFNENEKLISKTVEELSKSLTWLDGLLTLQRELDQLTKDEKTIAEKLEAFSADRKRLIEAQKAEEIQGVYTHLTLQRKEKNKDQTAVYLIETKLPKLQLDVNEKALALQHAEVEIKKVLEIYKKQQPLIQKVRELDQRLGDKKIVITSTEKDYKEESVKLLDITKNRTHLSDQRESLIKEAQQSNDYLVKHRCDEILLSSFEGIETQLTQLKGIKETISLKSKAKLTHEKISRDYQEKCDIHTKSIKKAFEKLENYKRLIKQKETDFSILLSNRLLREYEFEKESLLREMAFISKIHDLETERTALVSEKPCPLCGSLSHPYSKESLPKKNDVETKIDTLTEIIKKAESFKNDLKELDVLEKKALSDCVALDKEGSDLKNNLKSEEKRVEELSSELQTYTIQGSNLIEKLDAQLEPLGVAIKEDMSQLIELLRHRRKVWSENQKKSVEFEKKLNDLQSQEEKEKALYEVQKKNKNYKQAVLTTLTKEYDTLSLERTTLFGVKDTLTEASKLEKDVENSQLFEKTCKDSYDHVKRQLDVELSTLKTLHERLLNRDKELVHDEENFKKLLDTVGFDSESIFLSHCLSKEIKERLILKSKELDKEEISVKSRKKDRESRLLDETSKQKTTLTKDDLLVIDKEQKTLLQENQRMMADLEIRLKNNHELKEKLKEQLRLIEAQKKDCGRWSKLHELIGSSDGKKYRNFAQGLTFEVMVSHANRQLSKMSDRYLLSRDDASPLDLNVIDLFQAGEVRSVKNLSGGESFIVSLSLALGLSKMASRNVRVDSLFLDEGFGTLDDESLETALDALSGLQHDGKLIGIISHVLALKERICTQISVSPTTGGRSVVSGPGVSKLTNIRTN